MSPYGGCRANCTVTLANAPASKVYVTSLALVTEFVMLWLPSWLKQVFVCGVISTETDPVHRVVIRVAPADTRHVPIFVIIGVLPSGRAGQSVISRRNDSLSRRQFVAKIFINPL